MNVIKWYLRISMFATTSLAGTITGNGGDVVFCNAEGSKFLSDGYYAFDYVFGDDPQADLLDESNIAQIVSNRLGAVSPLFQSSFDDFRGIRPPGISPLFTRTWRPVDGGLIPISSADGIEAWKLTLAQKAAPSSCRGNNPHGTDIHGFKFGQVRMMPAVRRVAVGDSVVYYYNKELYLDPRYSKTQQWLTYVHEWFWDLLNSSNRATQEALVLIIADANRATNSQVPTESLTKEFHKLGIVDLTKQIEMDGDSNWYYARYHSSLPRNPNTEIEELKVKACRFSFIGIAKCLIGSDLNGLYCNMAKTISASKLITSSDGCVDRVFGPVTAPSLSLVLN